MRGPLYSIRSLLGLALVALLSLPGLAAAQDGGDEPAEERPSADLTEEQLVLNDEGVRSLIEGDYAGAVAMLTRSIKLGPSNVAYLNLGRAYQKLGDCEQAREALETVDEAPVVENPPPSEVNGRAEEFLSELEHECETEEPADEPGDTDEPSAASDSQALDEPPESAELPNPNLRPETPPESGGGAKTWGILTISTAAVLLGGSATMFVLAQSERSPYLDTSDADIITDNTQVDAEDAEIAANRFETIGWALGGTGAALAGVGVYLLVKKEAPRRAGRLSLEPSRNGVSISWRTSF
jgi:tetratricopeptide (TPR) repeat protein